MVPATAIFTKKCRRCREGLICSSVYSLVYLLALRMEPKTPKPDGPSIYHRALRGLLIDRTKGKGMNSAGASKVEAINTHNLAAAPPELPRPPGNTMEGTVRETVLGLIRNARNTPTRDRPAICLVSLIRSSDYNAPPVAPGTTCIKEGLCSQSPSCKSSGLQTHPLWGHKYSLCDRPWVTSSTSQLCYKKTVALTFSSALKHYGG